jgi:hypothetical protein
MNYTNYKELKFNGKTIKYKEYNGIYYQENTSDEIVSLLDWIKENNIRVRFHWGDTKTGKDWGDRYDVTGTIGRSTGEIKIPLLIKSKRSIGGGHLLDDCIVMIKYANKKQGGIIYKHPKYHI